jgi:hypothetical protein
MKLIIEICVYIILAIAVFIMEGCASPASVLLFSIGQYSKDMVNNQGVNEARTVQVHGDVTELKGGENHE